MTSAAAAAPVRRVRPRLSRDDLTLRAALAALGLFLLVGFALPIGALLIQSFQDKQGGFVGLTNFARYVETPALAQSIGNSVGIAALSTAISVGLAFLFAYGLTRTRMPLKGAVKAVALAPLLAPSLLPGISLVYLFGNQGLLKSWMMGGSIYGPIGIVIGEVFWTLPHALLILITSLSLADARLYEAAHSLRATSGRIFLTVTLPGAKYGLISALFVVFTLVVTDFGVPKVIGGQFNVLATDIYKQVIGQQNFQMGAVVGMLLLLPAVIAFAVDRVVARRQAAALSARAVPYEPKPNPPLDALFLALCGLVALAILGMFAIAAYASFVKFWPYDLSLSLKNYQFDLMDGGGWGAYFNSIRLALYTAVVGAAVVFVGAYAVEKTRGAEIARGVAQFLAIAPLAAPGLALGLGYIFFFNAAGNPLNFLYGTMGVLVLCTVVHFYSVPHLTALTALKQLDPEFESVSASLKAPIWRTFLRVTTPVSAPALLDISMYFFVNAMTTVSAVVFLYSPQTTLASVAVLNMDDAGDVAPAAAMAMMIVYTSVVARLLHALLTRGLLARTQAWRRR